MKERELKLTSMAVKFGKSAMSFACKYVSNDEPRMIIEFETENLDGLKSVMLESEIKKLNR